MEKNSYITHKTILGILINILGIAYFAVLTIATQKVLVGLAVQVTHTLEAITGGLSLNNIIDPLESIIYLTLFAIIAYLWLRILRAISNLNKTVLNTKSFLKNLQSYHSSDLKCYVLKTNKLFAFTAGLLNPRVYISEGVIKLLSKPELSAVIFHENHHVSQLDPLKSLISRFIEQSTPWLPFKSIVFKNYETISELSADSFVFSVMQTEKSLLKALSKLFNLTHFPDLAFSSFSLTIERIPILTGKSILKCKSNYLFLLSILGFISYLGISINSINPIAKCNDFNQCISSVFVKNQLPEKDGGLSCISN